MIYTKFLGNELFRNVEEALLIEAINRKERVCTTRNGQLMEGTLLRELTSMAASKFSDTAVTQIYNPLMKDYIKKLAEETPCS
jgi:hypothetical protein